MFQNTQKLQKEHFTAAQRAAKASQSQVHSHKHLNNIGRRNSTENPNDEQTEERFIAETGQSMPTTSFVGHNFDKSEALKGKGYNQELIESHS